MEKKELKALKENETKQVTPENLKYIAVKDLTAQDLKSFQRLPITIKKDKTKAGSLYGQVLISISEHFLSSMLLTNNGKQIGLEEIETILMLFDFPIKNAAGYINTSWIKNVPVRIVKGYYKNDNGVVNNYYALEVFFGLKKVFYHFFNKNQVIIINGLIEKNKEAFKVYTKTTQSANEKEALSLIDS